MTTSRPRPNSFSAIANLLSSFTRHGRELFERYAGTAVPARAASGLAGASGMMAALATALLSVRGEASGVAIARDMLALYEQASIEERERFFKILADDFDPDPKLLDAAWANYLGGGRQRLSELAKAAESPRQELFRRLNLAPGGTASLVRMRSDLLKCAKRADGALECVDADLSHLLQSWFNRGFLVMRSISWASPGHLLEQVIRYEAVHHIRDWDDLRRRLDPPDRRCFGFFHPAMPDEPLIFVEVGLTRGIPSSIQAILSSERDVLAAENADTAVFYSISNSQDGLRGISFGHFLIKQVAEDLKRELPNLGCFVTLSPVPGFLAWLRKKDDARIEALASPDWHKGDVPTDVRTWLTESASDYFLEAKNERGKPVDPVARFHLGNGARLERLNWMGDTSSNGLRHSAGFMVNYLYDLPRIEENHEAYAERGSFSVGETFRDIKPKKSPRKPGGKRERILNGELV